MPVIGSCRLDEKPRIIAVVDECIAPEMLSKLIAGADLLEMRIDCYLQPLEKTIEYLHDVRTKIGLPMVGTVRENEHTTNSRPAIFKAIIPYVDCIDIELDAAISSEVIDAAKGKTIIVSEHNFEITPDFAGLQSMLSRSKEQGAHIVKIATMANNREDVVRLLEFTRSCGEPIITIAMGSHGTITRVMAPLFGSLMSYGYLVKPVVPEQLSVAKLTEEFKNYYPG